MPENNDSDVTKLPFERAIEELESIVKRLEEGKVPLEESVTIYERGVKSVGNGGRSPDDGWCSVFAAPQSIAAADAPTTRSYIFPKLANETKKHIIPGT